MRSLIVVGTSWLVAGGCAGAQSGYGPGMTKEARSHSGCSPSSPGWVTCSSRSYNSGELEYGIQLGLRAGAAAASAGAIDSGTALVWEPHTDIVVASARWGVGVSAGYTNEHIFGSESGGELIYSGFPFSAYGQYGLHRRIFVHAGAGRVAWGGVKRTLPDETSADASAWRGFGGITFVFKRSSSLDLALRLEARVQRSSTVMLGGQDATWSSMALMGEIIGATF